jgi:hypothetical protein
MFLYFFKYFINKYILFIRVYTPQFTYATQQIGDTVQYDEELHAVIDSGLRKNEPCCIIFPSICIKGQAGCILKAKVIPCNYNP